MARREPNLPTLDAVMRGISRRMRADGLLPDRRRGVGMWAWRAAQGLALGALGLAYLLLIVTGVAVLDDVLNGPALSGSVTTHVRG